MQQVATTAENWDFSEHALCRLTQSHDHGGPIFKVALEFQSACRGLQRIGIFGTQLVSYSVGACLSEMISHCLCQDWKLCGGSVLIYKVNHLHVGHITIVVERFCDNSCIRLLIKKWNCLVFRRLSVPSTALYCPQVFDTSSKVLNALF